MSLLETVIIACPYCGEENELVLDISVSRQEYIEDCSVCCRPMVVTFTENDDGRLNVMVRTEEE